MDKRRLTSVEAKFALFQDWVFLRLGLTTVLSNFTDGVSVTLFLVCKNCSGIQSAPEVFGEVKSGTAMRFVLSILLILNYISFFFVNSDELARKVLILFDKTIQVTHNIY